MTNLKKVLCTGLALVVSVCTVLPLYSQADELDEVSEVMVSASEEAPFSLYEAARPDSEVTVLTADEQLQISEVGEAFALIHIEYEDGETVSGYVQTALLDEYGMTEDALAEDVLEATDTLAEENSDQLYLTVPEEGITLLTAAFQDSDPVFTVLQPVTVTVAAEYRYVAVERADAAVEEDTAAVEEDTADEAVATAEEVEETVVYAEYEAICEYLPEDETAAEEIEEAAESVVVEPEEILEERTAAPTSSVAATAAGTMPTPIVLDISHHQAGLTSSQYDKLASQIGLVIVRISDGTTLDKEYKNHITQFQKRGVPVHVYMYMRKGYSMDTYMQFFYDNAKAYDPIMYWLDFELSSFTSSDVSSAVKGLRSRVGDAKVGIYISHHLYETINPKVSEVDAVWIPRYGNDTGYYDSKYNPNYICDIHQYTSAGRLTGYDGDLDLSRLTLTNGKDLSYFSVKQGVQIASEVTYYTTDPGEVTALTTCNIYSSTSFSNSTKTGKTISKGTTVAVKGMAYASNGTPRLKVDGGYITANKSYVSDEKVTVEYITSNPGKITALTACNIYTSTSFKDSTKTGNKVAKGSAVAVSGMAYSSNGTPRLKVSGGYITANKAYVKQYKLSDQYYTSNPGTVTALTACNIYTSTTFKDSTKTGNKVAKGLTITVNGIAYTSAGTPRLKVSGGYVTANRKYVNQYYTSNPGRVTALTACNIYTSTTFNDSTKTGNKVVKGATVTVTGIAYTDSGTPRLKVDGGYMTANVAYVNQYYMSNPGTVTTLTSVNIYTSTTFKDSTKTGKKLAKGTTVKVTGMAYSSNGTPRLKVDGGYITANAAYVSQ